MFKTAIDARQDLDRLYKEIRSVRYNPDLYHIHKNLDAMITELSKVEVIARSNPAKIYMVEDKIKEIEKAKDYLEKILLMAKLMN